ncbi:hypothetical protein NEMIN01_2006 [Nematocida minor]|uniref:uncharacterized protein n=1 Tax=Nematocida minor TaxID=1912983 RepID=UPI00221F7FAD|nr:uncharacterized protein NEMIN01_2006 [Nematocida minor]KAI5192419.1 hypothetical protein NEMIN01_2006 [Nematocida minor]
MCTEQKTEKKPCTLLSFAKLKEQPVLGIPSADNEISQKTENSTEPQKEVFSRTEKEEKKKVKESQLMLNFGQKRYTKCHECGVMYCETLSSEARLHRKLHRKYVSEKEKADQLEKKER